MGMRESSASFELPSKILIACWGGRHGLAVTSSAYSSFLTQPQSRIALGSCAKLWERSVQISNRRLLSLCESAHLGELSKLVPTFRLADLAGFFLCVAASALMLTRFTLRDRRVTPLSESCSRGTVLPCECDFGALGEIGARRVPTYLSSTKLLRVE